MDQTERQRCLQRPYSRGLWLVAPPYADPDFGPLSLCAELTSVRTKWTRFVAPPSTGACELSLDQGRLG